MGQSQTGTWVKRGFSLLFKDGGCNRLLYSDGDDPAKRNGEDEGERKGRNARGMSLSVREGTGLEQKWGAWLPQGRGGREGEWHRRRSGWEPSYFSVKYEEKSLAEREDEEKMMSLNIFQKF